MKVNCPNCGSHRTRSKTIYKDHTLNNGVIFKVAEITYQCLKCKEPVVFSDPLNPKRHANALQMAQNRQLARGASQADIGLAMEIKSNPVNFPLVPSPLPAQFSEAEDLLPPPRFGKRSLKKGSPSARFKGLDIFRGLAVILMIITHGARLYWRTPGISSMGDKLLDFFMQIEPFTSALFLFLVGVGLVLSRHKAEETQLVYSDWAKHQLKRVIILYPISMLMFFLESGWQTDIYFSSGILSTIAIAIGLGVLFLNSRSRSLEYNLMAMVAVIIGTIFLEHTQVVISGLNGGPGGIMPLIGFSFLGSLMMHFYLEEGSKALKSTLIGLAVISLLGFVISGPWTITYSSIYKLFNHGPTGIDYIQGLLNNDTFRMQPFGFWNHSLLAFLRLLVILGLCFTMALKMPLKFLDSSLGFIGRHALGCYFLHLTIIGLMDTLGYHPHSASLSWLFIGGLMVLAYLYSWKREPKTLLGNN